MLRPSNVLALTAIWYWVSTAVAASGRTDLLLSSVPLSAANEVVPKHEWWNVSTAHYRQNGYLNGVAYAYVVTRWEVFSRRTPCTKEALRNKHTKLKRYTQGDIVLGGNFLRLDSGLWLNTTLNPSVPEFVPIEMKMDLFRRIELPYDIPFYLERLDALKHRGFTCTSSPTEHQLLFNLSVSTDVDDELQKAVELYSSNVDFDAELHQRCVKDTLVAQLFQVLLNFTHFYNPDVPWGEGAPWIKDSECINKQPSMDKSQWAGVARVRQWRYQNCKRQLHLAEGDRCRERREKTRLDGYCNWMCGVCRSPLPIAETVSNGANKDEESGIGA